MVKNADIFIHNSRPQAIERLGLGYDALKDINPSLIYAYSLGYARKGPQWSQARFRRPGARSVRCRFCSRASMVSRRVSFRV